MAVTTHIVGANAERARSHNRRMVLDWMRQSGQVGRAEIARGAGLSTQAVSNIIADLLADGLIAEQGRRASGRGQPPVQYGLNPVGGFSVGIELRPDAVLAAVLDLVGSPVASLRSSLEAQDLGGVTAAVCAARDEVLAEACVPESRILGAGIVMPGPFGPTGLSGTGSEFSIFHEVTPSDWFSEALGLPVVVEKDANAAAVAERMTGVAKGLGTFAFIYFGSGLGLGVVQDGRLVTGAFGNAGELGHIPVSAGGRTVALESVLSRLSVQRHLRARGITADSAGDLDAAFAAQDPALLGWLAAASEPLSQAVTIVENMLDPQTVILGGAMPDAVLDHLITSVGLAERSVAHRSARGIDRLMRGTSGRMTGALGAAALVISRAFTPRITAAA